MYKSVSGLFSVVACSTGNRKLLAKEYHIVDHFVATVHGSCLHDKKSRIFGVRAKLDDLLAFGKACPVERHRHLCFFRLVQLGK